MIYKFWVIYSETEGYVCKNGSSFDLQKARKFNDIGHAKNSLIQLIKKLERWSKIPKTDYEIKQIEFIVYDSNC